MPALPSGAAVSLGFGLPPQNLYLATQTGVYPVNAAQFWPVFLLDGDRLVEVDLRTRGVRTLHESPGMTSVAVIQEPILPPANDGRYKRRAADAGYSTRCCKTEIRDLSLKLPCDRRT